MAVLDTGIDDLPDFSGRLVGGVDLTGEGQPVRRTTTGTAPSWPGLIAGDGASSGGQYSGRGAGRRPGVDQGGGRERQSTRPRHADLRPAVGGGSREASTASGCSTSPWASSRPSPPSLNPLDQAVEAAWNAGITVVTSAGNAGPFNGTILSPGDDPLVITVGALDDMAQPTSADDEMNDFSSVGPTSPDGWAKPDLVTSGRSVVSLAAPGSTIYDQNPSARIGLRQLRRLRHLVQRGDHQRRRRAGPGRQPGPDAQTRSRPGCSATRTRGRWATRSSTATAR